MFCEKCGAEMQENKCPECGYVKEEKKKINPAKLWWFWLLVIVAAVGIGYSVFAVVQSSEEPVTTVETAEEAEETEEKTEQKTEENAIKDTEVDENEDSDKPEPEETTNAPSKDYSASELEALIKKQDVRVIKTKYTVQDDKYKALYPDMLQAIIQNDTSVDIRDAVVAFVGWDEKNLPEKIEGTYDYNGGSYVKEVNYTAINLASGETYGHNSGLKIDENNNIETVKAIVVSFTTFEDEKWENPYYEAWCNLYEGKKLEK